MIERRGNNVFVNVFGNCWTAYKVNLFVWYLKQLLPLAYWSKYRTEDGVRHFVIWRMWFGRCFDITRVSVQ